MVSYQMFIIPLNHQIGMTQEGVLVSINISKSKGEVKRPVGSILVTENGLEGDAHSGDWHRQVSLLSEDSIDKMRGEGVEINYGDFAENLTVKSIDLLRMQIGAKIQIGDRVVLEVTQIGKECHQGCAIRKQIGDCVMPREGIFTKVVHAGSIKLGDRVIEMELRSNHGWDHLKKNAK